MKSKYNAKRFMADGEMWDSKREYRRYLFLIHLVDTGQIKNLCRQVEYELIPIQREPDIITKTGKHKPGRVIERKCSYIADFQYEQDGETVVEDVKGYRRGGAYAVFTIKRKLMLEKYGIRVLEVK
jgi:Protein of unknown function (DUF1064).